MNRSAFYDDNDESDPLIDNNPKAKKLVGWDKFKNTPRVLDSGSTAESKWIDLSVQVLKVVTYIVVFVVVLGCAIVSKGTLLFFTSQISVNVTRRFCNINYDTDRQFVVQIPIEERVLWIWIIIFSYFVPQLGTLIRSVRICIFKSWGKPNWTDFFQLLITECLPAIGSAILVFIVLPELDVVKGAMLTNAFCFIPLCVAFLSRDPKSEDVSFKMILDITCIVAQASAFVMWPIIEGKPILYFIPISIILISLGWWENFVSKDAKLKFLKKLGEKNRIFKSTTYYYYSFISVINALVFFCTTLLIFYFKDGEVQFLFDNFHSAFSAREMSITEIKPIIWEDRSTDLNDVIKLLSFPVVKVDNSTYICLFLINIATTYLCYAFGKFACKVMIQGFSFAFAINMAVPALLSGLISMSGNYDKDECAFWDTIPDYLFFNTPGFYFLDDFLFQRHSWIWLIWLLSQAWVTIHIWSPKCEKLARTEHLFFRPMYDAFLIDQSLAMNRRRDDEVDDDNTLNNEEDTIKERIKRGRAGDDQPKDPIKPVTRIYACATMWHESKEEMSEFLKSVMRLDEDQCAHKLAKNYFAFDVPYYELETNIYFDDAFVREDKDDDDPLLNSYVQDTIPSIEKAASDVHGVEMKLRPPYIYSTPYGGRLEWILPGRTKLIIHMKDKKKIRNKKRWSQCMYMYQLLGHRLMDNDQIRPEDILGLSHNTYILALDGDIDFQPEALHLLVEYMKKNGNLGAACGRIHPVGSGAIAWYQVFEYAVGHWLQKATEHVIGCVLCSPGCFSLFRARALMEDRVMCKYTTRASEARHYVQYDQGEDRWLCTLLLQEGFRVEYSAASDAYTHCPESFNEFYNQRRRWMPSTMANIMDLLSDYKHVVKRNDNISMLYIFYQIILLIGTIIGPGTIFLMLVGGFVSVFQFDQWHSLLFNGIPIIIFTLVCATCKSDTQLLFAGILSAIYGLVMMAVMIGVVLQIRQDGILAPSSVFFFFLAAEFIVAALLHPKEFYCLKYGVIYYVTVPSMYMLLVIYSVFNMNNVSWGTRDVSVLPTKKVEEEEVDGVKEKPKEVTTTDKVLSFFGANQKDDEGSIEFSCAGLFKCLFCTHAKEENTQLLAIQESIALLSKKLDSLEEDSATPSSSISVKILKGDDATPAKPTMGQGKSPPIYQAKSDDEIIRNSWFYDELLQKGEVKFLQHKEEKFWKMLIDKYLHPIDDTENKPKVEQELKDLRDKMVFTFYMLNSLFVLVIFLLTLQKDIIHINWPFNPSENFTYIPDQNEIYIYKDYLHLEPIGFVFLIFFALLLVIQSFGMFLHRFGTFSQIICNTSIDLPFVKKDIKNSVDGRNLFTKESAIKIVKKLQQLRKKDTIDENTGPGRKSVAAIALQKEKDPQIYDLEEAFRDRTERYHKKGSFDEIVPRKTMMQLDNHIEYRKSLAVIKHQGIALNTAPDPISTIPTYVDDGTFA